MAVPPEAMQVSENVPSLADIKFRVISTLNTVLEIAERSRKKGVTMLVYNYYNNLGLNYYKPCHNILYMTVIYNYTIYMYMYMREH